VVTFFSTKVKNLIFMLLTLVQEFLMSISTLLPYEQILFARNFILRGVRKSEHNRILIHLPIVKKRAALQMPLSLQLLLFIKQITIGNEMIIAFSHFCF
jgi:hypothetical protein